MSLCVLCAASTADELFEQFSLFRQRPEALLAAKGQGDDPRPHVVLPGPNFPESDESAVVGAGGGALRDLIDASIVGSSDRPDPVPSSPADSIIDAFVYDRVSDLAGARGGWAESLFSNLDRSMEIEGRRFKAGLSDLGNSMLEQAIKATELMRPGLTRCGMVGILGGWNSHGDNTVQGPQFEEFFKALSRVTDHRPVFPVAERRSRGLGAVRVWTNAPAQRQQRQGSLALQLCQFVAGAADDMWVTINNTTVISLPGIKDFESEVFTVDLSDGQYPLEIRFAHRRGDAAIRFRPVDLDLITICCPGFSTDTGH